MPGARLTRCVPGCRATWRDSLGLTRPWHLWQYHASHRHQTAHWPSPPLEHITAALLSLPRTTPAGDSWLIVDLGCGDAGLAKALAARGSGKRVLSFDLVGDIEAARGPAPAPGTAAGWVVPIDFLTRIPLPGDPGGRPAADSSEPVVATSSSGSSKKRKRAAKREGGEAAAGAGAGRAEVVDVAVCCLSLMGINWVGGVYEACRVLREGWVIDAKGQAGGSTLMRMRATGASCTLPRSPAD